jgi:TRAP-type C4-dicarboxylate transport system permease small subunit
MLICVVFITLPYVVSSGASIRMEELLCALPPRLQQALRIGISGMAAGAFAIAAWSVGVATMRNLQNATPALGIPYWIFFSAAFLGLLFSAAESAVICIKAVMGRPLYVRITEELPPDEADLDQALTRLPSAGQQS